MSKSVVMIFVLLVFLSACGGSNTTEEGNQPETNVGSENPACLVDADCENDFICQTGECVEKPATDNSNNSDTTDDEAEAIDTDKDDDGIADNADNCPVVQNVDQTDTNGDKTGDACDTDIDGDGVEDITDNCPMVTNNDQIDADGDGFGNACDSDDDNDGILDDIDNCKTSSNPDQKDTDNDKVGDACSNDDDGDGILDESDNCPLDANFDQSNIDADALGDICDSDMDGDGIPNATDNCPAISNNDQDNIDSDELGDNCDDDIDGDGVSNEADNCISIANSNQNDFDNDGLGTVCDLGEEISKFISLDSQQSGGFGRSVAINNEYVVIGALGENNTTGATYIFHQTNDGEWTDVAKIISSDAAVGDGFGGSVAIDGDYVVVGAPYRYIVDGDGKPIMAGVVYVFKRIGENIWQEVAILTSPEPTSQFGDPVSISGDYIVVGDGYQDNGNPDGNYNSGAVYVFHRGENNDWSSVLKLTVADSQQGDFFGHAVSIRGDYIIAGSYFKNTNWFKLHTGAAYIFQRVGSNSWAQTAKLTASDAQADDWFGMSVAINGNYVIVGAPLEDGGEGDPNLNSGATYIYKRLPNGDWIQLTKITASDANADDNFGYVATNGDYFLIGAYGDDLGVGNLYPNAGSAYIYQRISDSNWIQLIKINASDFQSDDRFGCAVAIDNNYLVVGALGEDGIGNMKPSAGAAYIFSY